VSVRWEVEIEKNGPWPTRWCWRVWRKPPTGSYGLRSGYAFTKNRAHREAARAKLSMERDDVRLVHTE
jgi:hypothetical protein